MQFIQINTVSLKNRQITFRGISDKKQALTLALKAWSSYGKMQLT
jgi:hypothetical protein